MAEVITPTKAVERPIDQEILGLVNLDQMEVLDQVEYPPLVEDDYRFRYEYKLATADFGIAPAPYGDVYVGILNESDNYRHYDRESDRDRDRQKGRPLIELTTIHLMQDKMREWGVEGIEEFNELFGILKFSGETPSGETATVLTAPTVERINSVVSKIYEQIGGTPPFIFTTKEGAEGITGKEYIESLARGEILISSPDNELYYHDISQHILGFLSMDASTADLIKERALELVQSNSLTTNDYGELTKRSARALVSAVDNLSARLNSREIRKSGDMRRDIKILNEGKKTGMAVGLEIVRTTRRLNAQRRLTSKTIKDLRFSEKAA